MDCTRLGCLLVTPMIRAPSEQHTYLESASGQQTGASVHLRRKSPISHHLAVLSVTHKGKGGCRTHHQHLSCCDRSFVFSLQSSEVVLHLQKVLQGKPFPPAGSCCCKFLFFLCAGGGFFWLFGHSCGSAAVCTWNQLSNSFSASLMLCSLPTASCSSI